MHFLLILYKIILLFFMLKHGETRNYTLFSVHKIIKLHIKHLKGNIKKRRITLLLKLSHHMLLLLI